MGPAESGPHIYLAGITGQHIETPHFVRAWAASGTPTSDNYDELNIDLRNPVAVGGGRILSQSTQDFLKYAKRSGKSRKVRIECRPQSGKY